MGWNACKIVESTSVSNERMPYTTLLWRSEQSWNTSVFIRQQYLINWNSSMRTCELLLPGWSSQRRENWPSIWVRLCGGTGMRVSPERRSRSEEHTSELQSQSNLVCRLLLENKNTLISYGVLPFGHVISFLQSLWSYI